MNAAPPRIGITIGDPGGIGPEVVCKALSDPALRAAGRFTVFGPRWAVAGIDPATHITDDSCSSSRTGAPDFPHDHSRAGGEVSFHLVEAAIAAALLPPSDPGHLDAIVTGPISKRAWQLAGHGEFPGHTELLAARCATARAGMMFVTPRLRVILATAHIPLADVARVLTAERVLQTIELGHAACIRLGVGAAPGRARIAVCGLNPHAGEGGLLGHDEQRAIEPAIVRARAIGIDVHGPVPGDTVFNAAVRGEFDLVVAMYHDQGLIPVKLLDRDRAVNITVGLPIIRTSPDHGTAFDIAGQNRADPGSMRAAIELAIRMAVTKP